MIKTARLSFARLKLSTTITQNHISKLFVTQHLVNNASA